MKKLFKRLLCMVIAFTILPLSSTAFAAIEYPTAEMSCSRIRKLNMMPKDIFDDAIMPTDMIYVDDVLLVDVNLPTIGSPNIILPSYGLDIADLSIEDITYNAQVDAKGNIVMEIGDLYAAVAARELMDKYNAHNPENPVNVKDTLLIESNVGIRTKSEDLPDLESSGSIVKKAFYDSENRRDNAYNVGKCLGKLKSELSRMRQTELADRVLSLLEGFSKTEDSFSKFMENLYYFLYDMRAAIANGTLRLGSLESKELRSVIDVYRKILADAEVDIAAIEFWDKDEAWVAWAAANRYNECQKGTIITALNDKTVRLSDGADNELLLKINFFTPGDTEQTQPVAIPPEVLEIVSDSIMEPEEGTGNGTVTFIKGRDYAAEGVDGAESAPCFYVLDGPSGAVYAWTNTALPEGLELLAGSDSSEVYIVGAPSTRDEDGADVTLNARTTVDGQNYAGSLSFIIIVTRGAPVKSSFKLTPNALTVGIVPADESPADEPPADESPADEPPADEPPADEPPADEPPVDNTQTDNTPMDNAQTE